MPTGPNGRTTSAVATATTAATPAVRSQRGTAEAPERAARHAEGPERLGVVQLATGLPGQDLPDEHHGGEPQQPRGGEGRPDLVVDGLLRPCGGVHRQAAVGHVDLPRGGTVEDGLDVGSVVDPQGDAGLVPGVACGLGGVGPRCAEEDDGLDGGQAPVGLRRDDV